MKSYLLCLFCCFSNSFFAQKSSESIKETEFITKEITIESEGIDLSGILYSPANPDAAIVLVHGSGQEKRMEKMALLLAQNNIAVLTYDKRGVGKSGGIYVGPEIGTNNLDSSNLNLLAQDANAAVTELLKNLQKKKQTCWFDGI
ncbi:MAG: alpha/beta hydrolase [Flavobacterium sp.]